jgi:hypothetical protein
MTHQVPWNMNVSALPFRDAILLRDLPALRVLLNLWAELPDSLRRYGNPANEAIAYAASMDYHEALLLLVDFHANHRLDAGALNKALQACARHGNVDGVRLLIPIAHPLHEHCMALVEAVLHRQWDCVELLWPHSDVHGMIQGFLDGQLMPPLWQRAVDAMPSRIAPVHCEQILKDFGPSRFHRIAAWMHAQEERAALTQALSVASPPRPPAARL